MMPEPRPQSPHSTRKPGQRGRGRLSGGYEASEKDIQATIVQYLELRGYVFSVTDATSIWDRQGRKRASRVSHPGWPDITAVIAGRAVFIEVKSKRGRLSPQQRDCHARLRAAGAVVVIARNLEDVICALNERTEDGQSNTT